VLLMDNDVLLAPDCLEKLLEAFLSLDGPEEVALVQARTVFDDRPDLVQCDGGLVHFLGPMILRHDHAPLASLPAAVERVDSAITTAVLVDRDRMLRVGGFDEDFFIYHEDHDCSVRARLAGFTLLSAGAAVVRHRGGTAELSFRTGGTYTARRFFLQLRNRWLFVAKTWPLRSLVLLAPAIVLFDLFGLAYAVKKGFLGTWMRAAGWMFGHLPQIARKRSAFAPLRRVPLRAILQGGPYPLHPGLLKDGWQKTVVAALDACTNGWWALVRKFV
jgi:GT2 family glycosyltransferase